jgi:hypothetical protein
LIKLCIAESKAGVIIEGHDAFHELTALSKPSFGTLVQATRAFYCLNEFLVEAVLVLLKSRDSNIQQHYRAVGDDCELVPMLMSFAVTVLLQLQQQPVLQAEPIDHTVAYCV